MKFFAQILATAALVAGVIAAPADAIARDVLNAEGVAAYYFCKDQNLVIQLINDILYMNIS
ncbi:hypothetical protein N0V90_010101 [Kalmusia sp. IMI 367209]|nr:hypothetical protein N0V90_010101 [Kalmusia sp. IMI 367209]